MTRTFTDDSRVWIIFDTCTRPEYYLDVHKILAAPAGWVVRYDYREKYLTEDVVAALREENALLPRDVLLLYAQIRTHVRGAEPPKDTPSFDQMTWTPTRLGRMVNVVEDAGKFYLDFQVLGYPSLAPSIQLICRQLYGLKATPFWKWIAFADLDDDFTPVRDGTADVNWHEIVEQLDQPPSQFAGDLFWRITSIRKSGTAGGLELSTRTERRGEAIRQVRSYLGVRDSAIYMAEITTMRSPASRTGGTSQQFRIVPESDSRELLRVVGPGYIAPRQYTSDHLELETGALVFPKSRPVDVTVSTTPKDGDWAQGPELKLRFEVSKSWASLFWALLSFAIGSTIVVKEGRAVLVAQGSWADAALLVGGFGLIALGGTLWTGKLTTK